MKYLIIHRFRIKMCAVEEQNIAMNIKVPSSDSKKQESKETGKQGRREVREQKKQKQIKRINEISVHDFIQRHIFVFGAFI